MNNLITTNNTSAFLKHLNIGDDQVNGDLADSTRMETESQREKIMHTTQFQVPNITAFKPKEQHGRIGSILNNTHQKNLTAIEAQLVESRVKKLKKEEDKMLKRIAQTRQQAEKMMKIQDDNNYKYALKVQNMQIQDHNLQEQKMMNKLRKEEHEKIKKQHKQMIQTANLNQYLEMKDIKRQVAAEKSMMNRSHLDKGCLLYEQQVQQRQRAKSIINHQREMRSLDIKKRYQNQTQAVQHNIQFEQQRLQKACGQEDVMMAKLQSTIQQQRKAMNQLESQMQKNKIQRKHRVEELMKTGVSAQDIISPVRQQMFQSTPSLNYLADNHKYKFQTKPGSPDKSVAIGVIVDDASVKESNGEASKSQTVAIESILKNNQNKEV